MVSILVSTIDIQHRSIKSRCLISIIDVKAEYEQYDIYMIEFLSLLVYANIHVFEMLIY